MNGSGDPRHSSVHLSLRDKSGFFWSRDGYLLYLSLMFLKPWLLFQ